MNIDNHVFMNLQTDFAFKRLFGSVERKDILIILLNILFEKDGFTVYDVVFHDKEVLPDSKDGKRIMYDVYCTSHDAKHHFIVEMQQIYHPFFENRAVYYTARGITSQVKHGEKYDIKPVYCIFLVDFHLPNIQKKEFHDVALMDIDTHEIFSDIFRLKFVILKKAKEKWEDCENKYDKIVYLIKNMHKMDKESKAYKSGEFQEMFQAAELDNLVKEDYVAYSQSYLKYEDTLDAIQYSYDQGQEYGVKRGRKEGIKEGIKEGKERAISEMIEGMRKAGIPENLIEEATKLSNL